MLERMLDFVIHYLSGLIIVLVVLGVFAGCLFMASLEPSRNEPQASQRTKLCWLVRSENCF